MSNSKEISAAPVRPLAEVPIFMQDERPNIETIPSPKCQTILYKSAMEHLWGVEHLASFVLISKTFRNSSFGANLLMNFTVDNSNIKLFNNILTPTSCMSLQFLHVLTICGCAGISNFVTRMVNTKYFHLQLQKLTLENSTEYLISCFFNNQSPDQNWPQIKTLSFARGQICDADLEIVATNVASLTSLSLRSCDNITDTGLQHIAKLTSITSIFLAYVDKVSDTGLQHIAAKLTSLTTLE